MINSFEGQEASRFAEGLNHLAFSFVDSSSLRKGYSFIYTWCVLYLCRLCFLWLVSFSLRCDRMPDQNYYRERELLKFMVEETLLHCGREGLVAGETRT